MWGDRPGPVCNNTPLCTVHCTLSLARTPRQGSGMFRAAHCINVITVMGFTEAEEGTDNSTPTSQGGRCIVRGPMAFAAYSSLRSVMKDGLICQRPGVGIHATCKKSRMPCAERGPQQAWDGRASPVVCMRGYPSPADRCKRETVIVGVASPCLLHSAPGSRGKLLSCRRQSAGTNTKSDRRAPSPC